MSFGYTGNVLHVDLTGEKLWIEHPSPAFYRSYVGGSAMGVHYVLTGMPARADALGPDNVLTFFTSVVTGTPVAGLSRVCVNARSPLTGAIGDAQAGGFFPAELKFAGFDGVVITGQAARPVYLWLHDDEAELRSAAHLWGGRTTTEVEALIKQELGDPRVQVAQCGPAGERMVRLANVINMRNRAAGRNGLGAVMGSKNLKAVVVRGRRKVEFAHPERVRALSKRGAGEIEQNGVSQFLKEFGTPGVLGGQQAAGTFPAYNFSAGQFAEWENLSGETYKATILAENDTCHACSVRCKRVVETEWAGRRVARDSGGPEYESLGTLGSYCGISDLKFVAWAGQFCNEQGLDTVGTGATIAWAMECFENGTLSADDIGFALRWGDTAAAARALEMIATCSGFGAVLALGSAGAARLLGRGGEHLISVKGAEMPAHMPQAKRSLALIYAVQPNGADHCSHSHDGSIEEGASPLELERAALLGSPEALPARSLGPEKVAYAYATQKLASFCDSAGMCQFVWGPTFHPFGPAEMVELVAGVTGWDDFNLAELLAVGERRLALMRVFNAGQGFGREDDRLPEKLFRPLAGTGPTAGVALDRSEVERAIEIYYGLAGWDLATGVPTAERLAALDVGWAASHLKPLASALEEVAT